MIAIIQKTKRQRISSVVAHFGQTKQEAQAQTGSTSLTARLNSMIGAGASFDVSVDDFQAFGADNLNEAEKQFLAINKMEVLCTLQQALLVKHLFAQKPELRQTFISKIEERGAGFEVVSETTSKWFLRLLDTMPDRKPTK